MLDSRQKKLLKLIIENYIETAEPVGSKFLVEAGSLEISDATVRNEMRYLEDEGFLMHPHTSAGRIPTELGYQFYVDHLLEPINLSKKIKNEIEKLKIDSADSTLVLKQIGKLVAEEMHNAVLVAFGQNSVYYTGISGLFSQPEFRDVVQTINVSEMFDRCEELIELVFDQVSETSSTTLIGSSNPLGNFSSLVATRLPQDCLFMVMGPLRMDYRKSQGIVDCVRGVISPDFKF